ncbi:hypothetical protein QCA50_020611 [Cerrena zonata]|uniref:Uncharacterized protein n=1 Tax=Cerrena zonata TaxID=2478898 RepID=A0AAW0F978_9APHY
MTVDENTPAATSYCNKDIGNLPAQFPSLSPNVLDLFLLTGKSAVITGGARGIGYVISEAYCQAAQFPKTNITYNHCDVRKSDEVAKVIGEIHQNFGEIDIFVANAGIAWTDGPLIDQDNDDLWHNVVNVDLNGVYYCAKNIGRIFRDQGKGSLGYDCFNVCSYR